MKITKTTEVVGFSKFAEDNNLEFNILEKGNGTQCVRLSGIAVIDGPFKTYFSCDGDTVKSATEKYIKRIKGRWIQLNDEKGNIKVPEGLYYDLEGRL